MTREQLKEFAKRMTEASGLSEEQLAEKINDAFDNKSKPSLPSNLDEAAEKYSENILANNEDLQDAIEDAFKAGAEWMAGQGATMEITDDTEWADLDSFVHKNVTGGSIIQIRKK